MNPEKKEHLLALLRDTFAEEVAHLQLRMIRDAQEPRFEKLKKQDPEILEDFESARDIHDTLRDIRRRRIRTLTGLIEGVKMKRPILLSEAGME